MVAALWFPDGRVPLRRVQIVQLAGDAAFSKQEREMKVLVILALLFIWLAISTWIGRRLGTFLDEGEDDGKI